MSNVTICVSSREDAEARLLDAFAGKEQGAVISFPTVELLWKVITPKRWEILRAMAGAGPLSVRELSRRVRRDIKSVHGDAQALLKAGVVGHADDGRIIFPYDEIHVDFVLRAA